nr:GLPGLI family protein [uncultured Flavobacterium sp.]
MKNYIILIITSLINLIGFSQSFTVSYTQSLNINETVKTDFILTIIDKKKSLYQEVPNNNKENVNEISSEKGTTMNYFIESVSYDIYTNLDSKKILINDYIGEKNYIIEENLYPFTWEITSETKKISNYNCIKAKTKFRGRQYEIWFTEEIPTQLGPWKMNGLPGLILELYDKDRLIIIRATKINKEEVHVNKQNIIERIEKGKKISIKEYKKLYKEHTQELFNQMSAKMPAGFPPLVIDEECEDCQSIEIYEEWEE